MARFFAEQRVKLARPRNPENLGMEGVFRGYISENWCGVDWAGQWPVNAALSDQLEPIQPDGHKACDTDFKLDLDRLLEREGVSA